MIKAILSGSFNFGDVPVMELVPLHSRGIDKSFMTKRAAVLSKEIEALRPEKGRAYIHLIALGDQEAYGLNRNGDGFPKAANIERHHTFVKNAHAFRHHDNKDPAKASGRPVASAYNPDMSRVELIVGVDENKWAHSLDKLANGELPSVSMACRVPFDTCSFCKHSARTRAEYCDCLQNHITKVASNGIHIGAINRYPTYFDISEVWRNADRIAFGLSKVASVRTVGGAELAEELGIFATPHILFEDSPDAARKVAALERLAHMEKEIESVIEGKIDHRGIKKILPAAYKGELTDKEAAMLHSDNAGSVLDWMAKEGVCLPITSFYKMVYGPRFDSISGIVKEAEQRLPGVFGRLWKEAETVAEDGTYDTKDRPVSGTVKDLVGQLARRMSMRPGPSVTRITITAVRTGTDKMGMRQPVKQASDEAEFLASEYGKYQLAYASGIEGGNNDRILMLTALGNYVT